MAGTLFGLPLSQQITQTGMPMSGCLLYLYLANTTTPATAYQDSGLTPGLEHAWPIEGDANGRIPQFWLEDGSYRARLTDAAGTVQFNVNEVLAIGASSGDGGGGGGEVDSNSVLQTGDFLWKPVSGTRTGWVRANGRTIGSGTSGGTERANADCEDLFLELWNEYIDAVCPVTGGRGANAAADWAANKTIGTVNMQGVAPIGMVGMGGSDNGKLDDVTFTSGSKNVAASYVGASTHTLTEAEMPSHAHDITDEGHDHAFDTREDIAATGAVAVPFAGGAGTDQDTELATTGIVINNAGGSEAHANMQPSITGTWYIKL